MPQSRLKIILQSSFIAMVKQLLTMTIIITYGLLPGSILKHLLKLSIGIEGHMTFPKLGWAGFP